MAWKIKVGEPGNSEFVVLPQDLLDHLKWSDGDCVSASVSQDGSLQLTKMDPNLEKVMRIARKVMVEYAETFRALAKD